MILQECLYTNKESSRQNEKHLLDEATEGTPAAKWQPPLGVEVQATSDTKESPVSRAAVVAQVKQLRLPVPCPLPTNFTKQVTNAIKNNQLKGVMKTRLLRQAAVFYWGLCPRPTHGEYITMAVTLCENFPQLKDKKPINGAYWVSRSSVHIHACFSHTI